MSNNVTKSAHSMMQTNSFDSIPTRFPPIDTVNKEQRNLKQLSRGVAFTLCETKRSKYNSNKLKRKKLPPYPVPIPINYPRLTFQKIVIEIFSYKHTTRERELNDITKTKENVEGGESSQNKDILCQY